MDKTDLPEVIDAAIAHYSKVTYHHDHTAMRLAYIDLRDSILSYIAIERARADALEAALRELVSEGTDKRMAMATARALLNQKE